MSRLTALFLIAGLTLLPACGVGGLLTPFIDELIDEIFEDDQSGDQVPDDTAIGQAVDLEISNGGRFNCDPSNGVNQRVATVSVQHTGPNGSDPVRFNFIPESGSKLSANPSTVTLSRGEVDTIEIFASDCDFTFQEFRIRSFFVGDEGVPGRSTTTVLIITNIASDLTPAITTMDRVTGGDTQDEFIDGVSLVPFGEAVAHGDISVPDKVPSEALSEISYFGIVQANLDGTALESAFTGSDPAYPLGEGDFGRTIRADTPVAMSSGEYHFVYIALDGVFELINSNRIWRFGVAFDHDGNTGNNFDPPAQTANDPLADTDRWYFLDRNPGSGYSLRRLDAGQNELGSSARVILFENAAVFVIPRSEVPGPGAGFRVFTFTHTGDFGLSASRDWSGDHHPLPSLASVPD